MKKKISIFSLKLNEHVTLQLKLQNLEYLHKHIAYWFVNVFDVNIFNIPQKSVTDLFGQIYKGETISTRKRPLFESSMGLFANISSISFKCLDVNCGAISKDFKFS